MNCILNDKIQIADAVNVKVITLEEAPAAYKEFAPDHRVLAALPVSPGQCHQLPLRVS